MKKTGLSILFLLGSILITEALPAPLKPKVKPEKEIAVADSVAIFQLVADSSNSTFHYQQGHVTLPGGLGELTVPRGFRYLDSAQSGYVLHTLWHNPPQANLGMLFPVDSAPLAAKNWGYVIAYDPIGYVKDDEADDLNYDELLKRMQQDTEEANPARVDAGYEAVHVYSWGAKPYYDQQQHTLHWAKLLRFGSGLDQTLNYNVRVLGRKGVLVFNAVADPSLLPEIKASIPGLLANVQFVRGEQYRDFNPALDEVAAYSLGGLVAGKVLAKVGAFALIAKLWKAILLALGAAWTAIKRVLYFSSKAH